MNEARQGDPRTRAEHAVIVCGTAGGVGTSVISALLAESRAAASLGQGSWWVDASGNDCDLEIRLRGSGDPELLRTGAGTGLWIAPDGAPVTEAVVQVWNSGAVPVVDAGAHALTLLPDLVEDPLPHLTPVLVIGPRPDLLNRARMIFAEWARVGVLEHTVVVINSPVPSADQAGLNSLLTDVVSGSVADVIGIDYDPVLGAGTALDAEAQGRLLSGTRSAIAALAAATADRR
ncbi:hypothetical protein QSJ18_07260 [Gordonia sp. ABSL1-1]|uniref:hypothetical protein n=1 Tax=Gordonia sp. ABSL1-1 TaxID=3053923 RepID=UPI0025744882|nr:hypothetical protein [Gordonia sp. ABSL1-1]MDL9936536.1 hypothetical protein [Gordonia sp. ABSL1-1]